MRSSRRFPMAIGSTLVCLLLAAALANARGHEPDLRREADAVVAQRAPRFLVKGHVKGLYPGLVRQLRLRITNPNAFPIRVRSVTVKVQSKTASCPSKVLKVRKFAGAKRLGARRSANVKVQIRMRPTATDACQGARFRLVYGGKAVKA
jgi:hypothetical protein